MYFKRTRAYFIIYKDVVIYCLYKGKNNINLDVFCIIGDDIESIRKKHFSGAIKIYLEDQLTSKSLSETLPPSILSKILELKEVKSLMRDDKINEVLEK